MMFRAECGGRSEEHTSELQSRENLVCRLLPPSRSTLFPYTTLFRSRRSLRTPTATARKTKNYFVDLRRSLGVASQISCPLGGDMRFNSTYATPAFLSAVI